MDLNELQKAISKNRLNNEKCPNDLVFLIEHCLDLLDEMGIELNGDENWNPWDDKSYLTEEDLKDPEIVSNVKAIDDTFKLISVVAATDESEFIGYWKGVENKPISEAPIVFYSNDGQFSLCGSRFIESLFFNIFDDELLGELKDRANNAGLKLNFVSIDELENPKTEISPEAYHIQQELNNQ